MGATWPLTGRADDAHETGALVEARLGAPLDSAVARRLWSATRGNALYLRQLVDGELQAGRLRQVAGVWRWSGAPKLSPGLVELLSARLGELPGCPARRRGGAGLRRAAGRTRTRGID